MIHQLNILTMKVVLLIFISSFCSINKSSDFAYTQDYQNALISLREDKKNKFDLELFLSLINDFHYDQVYFQKYRIEFLELEKNIEFLLNRIEQRKCLFASYPQVNDNNLIIIQNMFQKDFELLKKTVDKKQALLNKINQIVDEKYKYFENENQLLIGASSCLEKKDYSCFSYNLDLFSKKIDDYNKEKMGCFI